MQGFSYRTLLSGYLEEKIMDLNHLKDSKWTAMLVKDRQRHFICIAFDLKNQKAQLKPVLKGKPRAVSFGDLKDPKLWRESWLP